MFPIIGWNAFPRIVLAGGYDDDHQTAQRLDLFSKITSFKPGRKKNWEFYLKPFTDQKDFYDIATRLYNHPRFAFEPLISQGSYEVFTIHLAKVKC